MNRQTQNRSNKRDGRLSTCCLGILVLILVVALCFLAILSCYLCSPIFTTAFAWYQSFRVGPVTDTPLIPFPQDKLQLFEGTESFPNLIPDAKLLLYYGKKENKADLLGIPPPHDTIGGMNEWMTWIFDLDRVNEPVEKYESKSPVPLNTKTISIKMDGFKHGKKCHDFEPIDGAAEGSFYTYQMFGDNKIQVTNYVENGVSYVAGFVIYIENRWLPSYGYRWSVVEGFLNSVKYPGRSGDQGTCSKSGDDCKKLEKSVKNTKEPDWIVLDCPKLQRKVMSKVDTGKVIHQEWSDKKKEMNIEECDVCSQKLKENK